MRRLNVHVLTLFPGILAGPLNESILKRARDKGLLDVDIRNIRDYTDDKHKTADDSPYGGEPGMVLKPEPIFKAIEALRAEHRDEQFLTILLSPQGSIFDHRHAERLSEERRRIVLLCGHYEAVDERVRAALVDEELSIGDYVLTGGELAALVVIDAAARLLPGVLGDEESAYRDSFGDGLLDHPHYTRPAEFRGMKVPDVLLSGNHEAVRKWRRREALRATLLKRPDLLAAAELTEEDRAMLADLRREMSG
ncbi:MAG: tRNA (guanosine(37)-N1)-methyltransferase TrmD [Nitrospirae bacterium GWC2_57_13]|nr:MAG: tRNA (guanosine(37)-N1)-methyltransferase TrmD [Nitrospirae bacterium GWC1_57_7]OGW28181.1 MAG: tRNA (guanosine(37)-N1)-methyltransferase TrmD [Nitrospirae bacterium GWC2_57_13]